MRSIYLTRAFFRNDRGLRRSGLEGVEVRAREGSVQQRRSHSRRFEIDRGAPVRQQRAGAQPCARVVLALRVSWRLPGFGGLLVGRMRVRVDASGWGEGE